MKSILSPPPNLKVRTSFYIKNPHHISWRGFSQVYKISILLLSFKSTEQGFNRQSRQWHCWVLRCLSKWRCVRIRSEINLSYKRNLSKKGQVFFYQSFGTQQNVHHIVVHPEATYMSRYILVSPNLLCYSLVTVHIVVSVDRLNFF